MPKTYTVTASFPQALAKHHTQYHTVTASSIPLALKRGLQAIMKRPGIKGLRHKSVSLHIVLHAQSQEEVS